MTEKVTSNFIKFYLSLFDLDQSFNRLKQQYARIYGIKPVHILWLYLLSKHPEGLSSAQLSQYAHIDKALVSRELQKLLDLGLITRRPCGKSNYNAQLIITENGLSIAHKTEEIVLEIQSSIYQQVNEKELQVFYEVSKKITDIFDQRLKDLKEDKQL